MGMPAPMSDEDRLPDGTIKPGTQKARDRLTELQSPADCQALWAVDLEGCLGKVQGKADPAWQAEKIEPKADDALQRDHPDYFKTCEAVRAWAMQSLKAAKPPLR